MQQGKHGADIEHIGELPGYHGIVRFTGDGYTVILLCNAELFLGRITDDLLLARARRVDQLAGKVHVPRGGA